MENNDLIPVIILRVNVACCKDCPQNMFKALRKIKGIRQVKFDLEMKKICIRSTLDPFKIIKEIADMGKTAELIFYNKEPKLEDHPCKNGPSSREKYPYRDEHKKNGREKYSFCPDYDPHETDRNCHEDERHCKKKENGNCSDYDPHKAKDFDHHDAEGHCKKNVRENGKEKYHDCNCSDYDPHKMKDFDHHDAEGHCKKNVRENDKEKYQYCSDYDPHKMKDFDHRPQQEDKKIPKMDDHEELFKDYCRRRNASWNHNDHDQDQDAHSHFRSKSSRYDGRNSQNPEPTPYEHYQSRLPSSYEHYPSRMPPPYEHTRMSPPGPPPPPPFPPPPRYYSPFSDENPQGCVII